MHILFLALAVWCCLMAEVTCFLQGGRVLVEPVDIFGAELAGEGRPG